MSAETKTIIGLKVLGDASLSMSIASTPEKEQTSTGGAQEQGMEQGEDGDVELKQDGGGIEAPDPSQGMGELAAESVKEMIEYEPIWRTYSNLSGALTRQNASTVRGQYGLFPCIFASCSL